MDKMKKDERKALAKTAIAEAIEYRDSGIKRWRKDRDAESMIAMFRQDCKDLKVVYRLFVEGQYERAADKLSSMDTAAREVCHDAIWKEVNR